MSEYIPQVSTSTPPATSDASKELLIQRTKEEEQRRRTEEERQAREREQDYQRRQQNQSGVTSSFDTNLINHASDFADGSFTLGSGTSNNGVAKEGVADYLGQKAHQADDATFEGFRKIENAASWMAIGAANYTIAQNASQYDSFLSNGGKEFVNKSGLLHGDALENFRSLTGLGDISDKQMESIANFGFYRTNAVKFSENEVSKINSYLNNGDGSVDGIKQLLGSKQLAVKDSELRSALTQISQTGSYSAMIKTSSDVTQHAKTAIAEKEMYDTLFSSSGKKDKAEAMEYLRNKAFSNLGISGFTGTHSQIQEICKLHKEPVRDLSGNIIKDDKGETKMRSFRMFTGKDGKAVEITEAQFEAINKTKDMVGEQVGAFKNPRSGKLRSLGTKVLGGDVAHGLAVTKVMGKISAKTAGLAYRGVLSGGNHLRTGAHSLANLGLSVAEKGVNVAGKFSKNGTLDGAKESLHSAKVAVKKSKDIALHDRKTRKDVNKANKDYRKTKKNGSKAEIQEARQKRDAVRDGRRAEINDRKNKRYKEKHDGKDNRRTRRENARNEKKERRSNKREGRLDRRQARRQRRKERFNNSAVGRKLTVFKDKYANSRTKRAFGRIRGFGKNVGGKVVKVIKAPFNALGKVTDFFARLKKKLFLLLASTGLSFMFFYLMICVVIVIIAPIVCFFSFLADLFTDDTNYGQLLVRDMREIKEAFVEMAKNDGTNYYKDLQKSTTETPVYSVKYGDGKLILTEIEKGKIQNYYVSEDGGNTYLKKKDGMGSVIPYFGIMHYRYFDEIDSNLYGAAKAYMFHLFVRANKVEAYNQYSYQIDYHPDTSKCGTCKYTHATTNQKGVAPSDALSTCDNYTALVEKGDLSCKHICSEWIEIDGRVYPGCYDTVYSYTCSEEDEGYYNSIQNGWDVELKQYVTKEAHVHTDKCNRTQTKGEYNCKHVHGEWNGESDPGCYTTKYTNTCNGHCAGIIRPFVDIYYVDSVPGLVLLETDPEDPRYSLFHPSAYIKKDVFGDIPDLYQTSAMKRFRNPSTDLTKLGWIDMWQTMFDEVNALFPKHTELDWSTNFFTKLTGEEFMIDKFMKNDKKDQMALVVRFPETVLAIDKADISYIQDMVGTEATGYKEGIETWAEFEVYFTEDNMAHLSTQEKELLVSVLQSKYGVELSNTAKPSHRLVMAALNNAGNIRYNDELSPGENSLRLLNTLLIGTNKSSYPPFSFYYDKSRTTNETFTLFGLLGTKYKDLDPGAILVDKVNKKVAIYLGETGGKYRIMDCGPDNPTSAIHYIGWDELETRFEYSINAGELNKSDWMSNKNAQKWPWPSE